VPLVLGGLDAAEPTPTGIAPLTRDIKQHYRTRYLKAFLIKLIEIRSWQPFATDHITKIR
jgi:hypothetical protein